MWGWLLGSLKFVAGAPLVSSESFPLFPSRLKPAHKKRTKTRAFAVLRDMGIEIPLAYHRHCIARTSLHPPPVPRSPQAAPPLTRGPRVTPTPANRGSTRKHPPVRNCRRTR